MLQTQQAETLSREYILSVVKKHLADTVDDLDVETIDPSRSMRDLGANSLDMVEVVSRTMRELKVKVPRSELSKLSNIDDLVDLLHAVAQQKAV